MLEHVIISGAVEGMVDEAVLRRLIKEMGATAGPIYGKNGKSFLLQKVDAYNQAARFAPWVILIDLDHDEDCAPPFRRSCLPDPAPYMSFRVAVREIEAWLLADRESLAKFLSVGVSVSRMTLRTWIARNPLWLRSQGIRAEETSGKIWRHEQAAGERLDRPIPQCSSNLQETQRVGGGPMSQPSHQTA